MLETAIHFVQTIPWYWILLFAMFMTFLENIFPPSPSDTVIVFIGALVASGKVGFIELLIATTIGSTLGFYVMYWLGEKFEKKVIESDKFAFISRDAVMKAETWFKRWGYWLIVANRFLSGTRAIIGFFAGMSELTFKKTMILSAVSALVWNAVLIYLGYVFGEQWHLVDKYMTKYGNVLLIIFGLIALGFLIKWIINKSKAKKS